MLSHYDILKFIWLLPNFCELLSPMLLLFFFSLFILFEQRSSYSLGSQHCTQYRISDIIMRRKCLLKDMNIILMIFKLYLDDFKTCFMTSGDNLGCPDTGVGHY